MTPPDQLFENALITAPLLLGYILVHQTQHGRIAGRIVETEAYTQDDPASHTFRGKTTRNAAMFEPAGTIYIYFTYGMHYCLNFVCGPAGQGEAVLIRALEPLEGLELMRSNRGGVADSQLTNGPAKLVQALGVTKSSNGLMIDDTNMSLEPCSQLPTDIVITTRVGISTAQDLPRRFYIKNNCNVSRP